MKRNIHPIHIFLATLFLLVEMRQDFGPLGLHVSKTENLMATHPEFGGTAWITALLQAYSKSCGFRKVPVELGSSVVIS